MSFPIPSEHIDHERFISYLQSLGFEARRTDGRRSIWYHPGRPDALAVFIPHQRLADYEELLSHALTRLATATGIPEEVHYTRVVPEDRADEFRSTVVAALAKPES